MIRLNPKLLAGVALSGLLAACSNSSNIAAPPPVATPAPTPAPIALQNQFGAAFSALFSASADVEATEPAAGAVPSLDLTKEGIDG
jgi:hypothetical protein